MNFKLFLLSIYLLSMTNSFAQKYVTTLWEVSKKGIDHKSYIFGTNHGVSGAYLNKMSAVTDALKKSDLLMTEVDYHQKNSEDTSLAIALNYIDYSVLMDNESYQFLDSVMLSLGNPSLDTLNSWKVPFTNIYVELFQNNLLEIENDDNANLDEEIYNLSVQQNKKFQSLDASAKALSNEDDKTSVQKLLSQSLIASFKNLEEIKKLKLALDNFYFEEKDYFFNKRVKVKGNETSKFMNDRLLIDRNNLWLPYIVKAINNGPTFIAVGFGHLRYKEGVLMQLKKKGYIIKPIDLRIIK